MPYVKIAASSSGGNTLVSGQAGYAIRVINFTLSFSGTVNAKFQSSTGPTDLTGLYYGATNTQVASPSSDINERGLFKTVSGDNLLLNLSAGTAVGGHLVYEFIAQ